MIWEKLKRFFLKFFERTPYIYDLSDIVIFFSRCSHFGPKEWRLYLWDRDEYYEFNVSQGLVWKEEGFFEKDSYCPECRKNDIIAKSISCCLCGRKIAPNSPVCLYSLTSRGLNKIKTVVDGQAVGCLRSDCDALNFCGWWTGETITARE